MGEEGEGGARGQDDATLTARAAELDRLVYAVAHDLQAPLVTTRSFLGFLREDLQLSSREFR